MIVRASSRAALVRVSPGTTNSRGISMPLLEFDEEVASRPSTIAAETRVWPSTQAIPGIGVGRELGADDEQLALEAEDQLGEPGEAGVQRARLALTPSSARARPSAATASSIVP